MHGMNGMHGSGGRSKPRLRRARKSRGGDKAPDPRRWLALIVIDLCLLAVTMDNTILNVALPTIARDLSATGSQLQWMVDAYIVVFAGLLLTAGTLGDRLGRRRMLLAGLGDLRPRVRRDALGPDGRSADRDPRPDGPGRSAPDAGDAVADHESLPGQ